MIKNFLSRLFLVLLIIIIALVIFLYGTLRIVYYGNNFYVKELISLTLLETSAATFIPPLFLTDEELNLMLEKNFVEFTTATTDINLVEIDTEMKNFDGIEFIEIKGDTYKGRIILINDPSRVYLATPAEGFNQSVGGTKLEDYVARDGAIGGINGGGFEDPNGTGNGSIPDGYVIQNGVLTYGNLSDMNSVVGFDSNNRLIVGYMSARDALASGVQNGLCFSLGTTGALVINGNAVKINGTGGGLNPRTAIGQRADGSILMLSIDGRQAHSLGASYDDLIKIFLEYDVINAGNLDGGSSSLMVYEGDIVSTSSSLYGSRRLPTAFLVK